jgi:hypothetical protein
MSLQQFIVDNRAELIKRTRAKVATRPSPQPTAEEMELGVPLFLSQLGSALGESSTQGDAEEMVTGPQQKPNKTDNITEGAIAHGKSLRKFGFTIEQVVHDYGDVCQAVTELAEEQSAILSTAEFHTLNRCLDNAIAGAVTSWSEDTEKVRAGGQGRRDFARLELLNLVCTATVSFDALRSGRVGSGGATATILRKCLVEMRSLLDDSNRVAD